MDHAPDENDEKRRQMIETQILARGVRDPQVTQALADLPRHLFVDPALSTHAYEDRPLPIGFGQTISQPYIVARMTELCNLSRGSRVLEIGTGCGYQTALLARLCSEVYTIEIVRYLGEQAQRRLAELGYSNIHFQIGNGSLGWPDRSKGPFDAILSAAAAPHLPPKPLLEQLRIGGTMVIPIGTSYQQLLQIAKTAQGIEEKSIIPVRFVPMIATAPEGCI